MQPSSPKSSKSLVITLIVTGLFIILIASFFIANQRAEVRNEAWRDSLDTKLDKAVAESNKVSIAAFNDVTKLRNDLEKVGIGSMRKWWSDGSGWMSASNYFEFGPSVDGALYDNLALYLESPSEYNVQTLKLNLTAYHKSDPNSAYKFMAKKAPELFEVIQLQIPNGLISAIKSKKEFSYSGPTFSVETDYDYVKGAKAESYRLIITAK